METRLDEIAPQIFRIAVWTGKAPITFNTLFGSDLGTHGGQREALTEDDRSEEVLALQQRLGYIPAGPHVSTTLARLRQLPITCLATMHGSALCGASVSTLFTALAGVCGGA